MESPESVTVEKELTKNPDNDSMKPESAKIEKEETKNPDNDLKKPESTTKEREKTKNIDNDSINILQEVKDYNKKQIYIITKKFESKIPKILSYLQNYENEIINKIHIVKYLILLIQNIPYNLDLILAQKSEDVNQKMNFYEILINEYIFTDKEEKEYILLLKDIIFLIFKKLSLNKDIYRYLFSFVSNYLNEKYQNEKNEKYYFKEYNYHRLLELILFFYQSKEDEDPINYFYFNGDKDTNIIINTKGNNVLNLENDLYILFFVKLIDYNYISSLYKENSQSLDNSNLLEIKLKNKKEIIKIDLNYKDIGETPGNIKISSTEESKDNKDNNTIHNISIPYKSFNIKETNNVLIKITKNMQIEIYVNTNKISLSSNILSIDTKSENIIDSIKLFNEFYGICSTLMLYRDNEKDNKLKDIYPKYLIENQTKSSRQISKFYQNGLFKEELLIPFIKAHLKNNVEEKHIYDNTIKNLTEQSLDELAKFIIYNLISIYIPTRTYIHSELKTKIEGSKEIDEEIRMTILVDSISNFNAGLNNKNLFPNLMYSINGGIHILSNILYDFSFDIGGINHFLPLIEVMTDYNELLTNENLEQFMSIILYLFSNHKKLINNEQDTKFFYYLSLFLEKIPENFYTDVSVHIKSILITLESLESEKSFIDENTDIFNIYKIEFFNNVCLNEKILFRFNFKDKSLIYDQINKFLSKQYIENNILDINIMKIINILLYHEKERYTHFCCKKHSEYFTKESTIMNPELNEYIKPLMNIIKLFMNQFIIEINNLDENNPNFKTRDQLIKLFELLTFDISPCLQTNILNLFFEFIQKNDEKYYNYLNVNNCINIITLFVYKTSLFDVKELAFNYLIDLAVKNSNKKTNLGQFIEKYTISYYYPKNEDSNERKYKTAINMNNINYHLTDFSESQKKLLSYYDKKHLNDLMTIIYEKAEFYYKEKICEETNFNILISIASIWDTNFITKLLKLIKDELKQINTKNTNINQGKIIYNSQKLLQWLLDTCYHAYIIKISISNKEEYIPGFPFEKSINNESEKEKIVDEIISISSEILLDIFYYNIYKLDYLLSWSKYYYELKEDKNKFLSIRKFIFDYFIEKLINKFLEKKNNKISFKYKLYLANIIFEYFSFYKVKGFASGGILKDLESLYVQVCTPFIYTLLSELKDKIKIEEGDLYLLNEKWKEYSSIKKYLGDLEFFGLEKESKVFTDESNIYTTFINGKHNMFFEELKIYFNNYKNFKYFSNNNINICNKGIQLILLKYHYYTLILTVISTNVEFKEILNGFSFYILLIIIASTTVSIDFSKNVKKEIWPNEEEYKEIQELVKIIIFNFFLFLSEKIIDMTNKIKKYENDKNSEESQNLCENFILIKTYLINVLFFFLRLLNTIYSDVKKQEFKRKSSEGYLKGWYNKIKNKFVSDKEGIPLTGGYKFLEEFKENCIQEVAPSQNINEGQSSTSVDNLIAIEEKKSFLDEIPSFTLNDIHAKDYSISSLHKKLEQLYINNFENNEKIKNYFLNYKEKYQRQLFPFVNYILKRNKLIGNIIPIYDNSVYINFDYNFLCLKPNYLPELSNVSIKMKDRFTFNKDLVDEIKRYQIKINFNEHDKIRKYRKIKKELFSFNGILSSKKYFYDKNKYICKYRLLNHMTEDYTRFFLTPIIDIDYYLPKFSKFELQNLFRNKNKDNLIQIKKISDLSLKELKKEESKEISSNINGLFLIKEAEFKNMEDLNKDLEGTFNHYLFFKKYIDKNHKLFPNYHNTLENTCLVKTSYHIRGFFYSNSTEIGFYSYDKIPYNYTKKSKKSEIKDPNIAEIQKDYDPDRAACFGSIFSPQNEKYEYLYFKIPYNEIIFIFKRRYYFKVSALEIYTTNKKSYLFKFDHTKLNDIISNLKHYMMPKIEDIYIDNNKFYNKIGFINLNSKFNNMNKKIYEKNYMNLKNIYENWKKWDISTIRLLMIINIYANRSYNDINQYPVFPWIIIDYQSQKFPKINSDKLMRPLDTPMGMLDINEDARQRKQDYLDHWQISQDDDDREDEFDRYGSHYSTSLYVSYYLVRVFPFANIRIELQGTSFDDPNRLFNSMRTSFDCSSTQKSDVRELIPELFCFPEMLLNKNDFNLGEIKDTSETTNSENTENKVKSKKVKLKEIQEVDMPKWCNKDAYLFIKKHRELLESYEVSNNLNEWLNLIFGSKQKGKEANKIKNLYNSQTYEDYEKTYDDMSPDDQEIACRMLEFGITPHQVFKSDASQRKINLDNKIKRQLLFNTFKNIKDNELNNTDRKDFLIFEEIKSIIDSNYVKYIYYFPKDKNSDNLKKNIYIMNNYYLDIYLRKTDKRVIRSDINPEKIQDLINPYYGEDIGDDEYDEIAVKIIDKKDIFTLNHFKYGFSKKMPIVWLDKGTIIVKGGYWNGNIILKNFNKQKETSNKINSINNSEDNNKIFIYTTSEYSPIIKIVVDKNETFAICGNINGTIYIFKINQNNKINWSIYKNINNHNCPITSIALHENLNIIITCSEDGLCMLYTLPYFKLYNSFIIGKDEKKEKNEEDEILCPDIALISDKPLPCFIFYVNLKKTIYFYSINGYFLKKQKLNFSIKENTIKIYTDFQFVDYLLIYNSKNKMFDIYSMIDFVLICRSPPLPEGDFVDYVMSKEMDHLLVLCKTGTNNYKLYILKDSETPIPWK